MSACQGVILLVDANDGVQAQTVANFYLAFGKDLCIIPVLNKIDLKNADPERVCGQLNALFDIDPKDVLKVIFHDISYFKLLGFFLIYQISAKHGTGVDEVLDAVVERLPPPSVDRLGKFRALLFDSSYDKYRGVLSLIFVKDGNIRIGDTITTCYTKKEYEVKSLSLLRPDEYPVKIL